MAKKLKQKEVAKVLDKVKKAQSPDLVAKAHKDLKEHTKFDKFKKGK